MYIHSIYIYKSLKSKAEILKSPNKNPLYSTKNTCIIV